MDDELQITWSDFESRLINMVRNEYPVICNSLGSQTQNKRRRVVSGAWPNIASAFPGLSQSYCQSRWRNIRKKYEKLRKNEYEGRKISPKNTKYLDGSLSFIDTPKCQEHLNCSTCETKPQEDWTNTIRISQVMYQPLSTNKSKESDLKETPKEASLPIPVTNDAVSVITHELKSNTSGLVKAECTTDTATDCELTWTYFELRLIDMIKNETRERGGMIEESWPLIAAELKDLGTMQDCYRRWETIRNCYIGLRRAMYEGKPIPSQSRRYLDGSLSFLDTEVDSCLTRSVLDVKAGEADTRLFFNDMYEYIHNRFPVDKQNEIRWQICALLTNEETEVLKNEGL